MTTEWASWMWEDKVRVALGYPRDGWVLLAFLTAAFNQHFVIHCSDVFCPFPDIAAWLRQIKGNDLPAEVTIDEEGSLVSLHAMPFEARTDVFSFFISSGESWDKMNINSKEVVFKCRPNRILFVNQFADEVVRWLREDLRPHLYGGRGHDAGSIESAEESKYLHALGFDSLTNKP